LDTWQPRRPFDVADYINNAGANTYRSIVVSLMIDQERIGRSHSELFLQHSACWCRVYGTLPLASALCVLFEPELLTHKAMYELALWFHFGGAKGMAAREK
jgi:hypothetical protein